MVQANPPRTKMLAANPSFKLGKDLGMFRKGWCGHKGAKTQWADINGDGLYDIICDDSAGNHWAMLSNGDGTFQDLG
jgi:hypothetical protein